MREVLNNDTALIAARITYIEPMRYTGRVKFLRAHLEQDGDMFTAVWFNMPYLAKTLKEGEYLFYGRVQNKYGQVSLVNPTFEPMAVNARLKGLVPVYPLKAPLTQRAVRTAGAGGASGGLAAFRHPAGARCKVSTCLPRVGIPHHPRAHDRGGAGARVRTHRARRIFHARFGVQAHQGR